MLQEVSKKKVNSNLLISGYCFEITGVEKKKLFLYFCVFFFDLYVIYLPYTGAS
jgi:hypothetical protein